MNNGSSDNSLNRNYLFLENYNQHTDTKPWYGAGQGARDACLWWIAQANSMILAYESVQPWTIRMPDHHQQFTQLINAFIDDTSIINATQKHQKFTDLLRTLQYNLDTWHDLLQASRGVLNPSKCVWLCFHWKFAPNGTIHITPPTPTPTPLQTTISTQPPIPIRRLQPNEAHHYLRIYLTTDANYKKELEVYHQWQRTYITLLQNCPFPYREVNVIYKQCYLPTVGYPLPATVIPPAKLNKYQGPATNIFLTKWDTLDPTQSNCIRTQRQWGSWNVPLWNWARPTQNTPVYQTHTNKHKHWKIIWNCTATLPTYVQFMTPSTPRHPTIAMEQCTVVWYHPPIPPEYQGSVNSIQPVVYAEETSAWLSHHGWHPGTQPTKIAGNPTVKCTIILTNHHTVWNHWP